MPSVAVMAGIAALACGVLISIFVFRSLDSTLASDPSVGRVYSELRDGVVGTLRQAARTLWSSAGERLHDLVPQKSTAALPVASQPADAADAASASAGQPGKLTQSAHRRELGAAHAAPVKLLPYITVGLTRDEVTAIEGQPTASSEDKLVYQGSEIYFTDGKVSGWKIDRVSAPLRVKLWPSAPVDPDLDSFGVGSSKNVVLVVQGTPTFFSGNKFSYGGSEVYFQNDRVVGWKDDPSGAPLRTVPR